MFQSHGKLVSKCVFKPMAITNLLFLIRIVLCVNGILTFFYRKRVFKNLIFQISKDREGIQ